MNFYWLITLQMNISLNTKHIFCSVVSFAMEEKRLIAFSCGYLSCRRFLLFNPLNFVSVGKTELLLVSHYPVKGVSGTLCKQMSEGFVHLRFLEVLTRERSERSPPSYTY